MQLSPTLSHPAPEQEGGMQRSTALKVATKPANCLNTVWTLLPTLRWSLASNEEVSWHRKACFQFQEWNDPIIQKLGVSVLNHFSREKLYKGKQLLQLLNSEQDVKSPLDTGAWIKKKSGALIQPIIEHFRKTCNKKIVSPEIISLCHQLLTGFYSLIFKDTSLYLLLIRQTNPMQHPIHCHVLLCWCERGTTIAHFGAVAQMAGGSAYLPVDLDVHKNLYGGKGEDLGWGLRQAGDGSKMRGGESQWKHSTWFDATFFV